MLFNSFVFLLAFLPAALLLHAAAARCSAGTTCSTVSTA